MKISKRLAIILLMSLALPAFASAAQAPALPQDGWWGYIRPGIYWQKFHLSSPREVNLYVARLQRSEPSATIDTGIAMGSLKSGRETTSGMAARYDDVINYWGYTDPVSNDRVQAWGWRNDVAVAINGYFFDLASGKPWSGVMNSGWYASRFSDSVGDAGFAWTHERQAFIGACVYHTAGKNDVTFPAASYDPNIAAINTLRTDQELILYTPQYAANTGTDSTADEPVLEIQVEMTEPNQVLPKPAYAQGFIRKIDSKANGTPIPFDHVVLSFWGEVRAAALNRINAGQIKVGDEVRISQEITDCKNAPTGEHDWTKTYASLGGDYHFLINGVYHHPSNSDANVPNSRTAVAYNNDFVYFVVVDAFDCQAEGGKSRGLNVPELSNFLKDNLGATDAVTMDSGGSSTMVISGVVVNNTQCNYTRDCGCPTEPVGAAPGDMPPEPIYQLDWDNPTGILEPLVGSSMMMVSVVPFLQSSTFTPAQAVATNASVNIRLGPGLNYASLASLPAGTQGEVISDLNGLNGVQATGAYWWRVDLGDLAGWVEEHRLSGGVRPPAPDFTDFQYMPLVNR
jgi:hypothetical protein